MINSRLITDLHPVVQKMALQFIKDCASQDIDIILTSTYRDAEAQNDLYAQGRTKPGSKVTNAKAGQSYHNYRLAFDVVPVVGGKAIWNNAQTWQRIGQIGEAIGLEWAGRWVSFKEMPHFQFTQGLSIGELQGGASLR